MVKQGVRDGFCRLPKVILWILHFFSYINYINYSTYLVPMILANEVQSDS